MICLYIFNHEHSVAGSTDSGFSTLAIIMMTTKELFRSTALGDNGTFGREAELFAQVIGKGLHEASVLFWRFTYYTPLYLLYNSERTNKFVL